jgi:outer membrane protein assembly factor BamA
MAAKNLDALLAMRRGDVADLTKIETGLRAVQTAYDKIGHLERRLSVAPRFDDKARTVVFAITIAEGPQYRMGAVEFVGFPAAEVANLTKKWRLRPGVVFDGSYPAEFQRDELRRAGSPVLLERHVNEEAHLVNVRFTAK